MEKVCEGLNCENLAAARGYCPKHLYRLYKYGDPEKTKKSPWYTSRKIFDKLSSIETDDCIIWTETINDSGYGVFTVGSRTVRTHRLALQRRVPNPNDSKLMALHKPLVCHNRACMNYRHLYWGIAQDNSRDVRIDGTVMTGERNHRSKLKREDVNTIRSEYASGKYKQAELAVKYGITQSNVSRVVNGSRWI